MRAWIIEVGEPLPIDVGRPRLMRAGLLTEELARRGHDVVWFTSAFDHHEKSMRPSGSHLIEAGEGKYELRLLDALGYRRHISPRRIIDHMVNARSFRKLAKRAAPPDVICVGLPTLELAAAATRFGRAHHVPVCVDVRDLWPDIFERALPRIVRPIAKVVLFPLDVLANRTCRAATSIVGVSEAFLRLGTATGPPLGASLRSCLQPGVPNADRGIRVDRHRTVLDRPRRRSVEDAAGLRRHVQLPVRLCVTRRIGGRVVGDSSGRPVRAVRRGATCPDADE